jgi:hypothetical protein
MKAIARSSAIFLIFYLASALVVSFLVPRQLGWHLGNCAAKPSAICQVSAITLRCWWLWLLPAVLLATLVCSRLLSSRRPT